MVAGSSTTRPQRLVLHGVSWREYTRMLRAFADRPGFRLTYDRGVLEIMSPLFEHEVDVDLLGRFVVALTEELGLPLEAGRSTTFRRRRMQRGLEPDHSWWIAHAPQMQGKRRVDLKVDPPPDLAIEVDVTHRLLDRMSIYARLGVPEVWHLDARGLTFQVLQPNGQYAEQTHSPTFPLITPTDLTTYLTLRAQHNQNEVVRQFRIFVRQRISGATGPATPSP
ncbi:MAG: Uma2 family endonuclease [Planctomycetes bacterium]|nr:Uma2 family endonuclease [Planctomycetota bacterium]